MNRGNVRGEVVQEVECPDHAARGAPVCSRIVILMLHRLR